MDKNDEMRKVAVIIGDENYLPQCLEGLMLLESNDHKIWTVGIYIRDWLQQTKSTEELLHWFCKSGVEIIIVADKGLNCLAVFCDAYLRHEMRNKKIRVVAAIYGPEPDSGHIYKIPNLGENFPDTQAIFKNKGSYFIGPKSFYNACNLVINGILPKESGLPKIRPIMDLGISDALTKALGPD